MPRFLRTALLVVFLAAIAAAGLLISRSGDPVYTMGEITAFGRHASQDDVIKAVAEKYGVDVSLIKAVVWRESDFHPDKMGSKGERGLMQVGEAAASDWARALKIETFVPTDLFEPRTNLEVGTWYLKRSLLKWKDKPEPIPFALAEYNAGASRVDRWLAASGAASNADTHDLLKAIDYPGTRQYVEDIVARSHFYQDRGGL